MLISNDGKVAENHFTHIEFKQSINNCASFQLLGGKLFSIDKNHKLAITKYSITVEDFINLYLLAYKTQLWTYRDIKVDSDVILDHVFPTKKKYIPSNGPTGGQYNLVVPFERSLYGTNFIGDYYICELYSQSKAIASALSEVEHNKIREIFDKLHLTFDLCKLRDRLGNIVCKFNVETITFLPQKSSAENGISFELARSDKCMFPNDFEICFFQEHYYMIYGHWIKKIAFDSSGKYEFEIAPNQCNNTIIAILSTGLISFKTSNTGSIAKIYL